MSTIIWVGVKPGETQAAVDEDVVNDWIDNASSWEVDRLDIDHQCDCPKPEPAEEICPHVLINCGPDPGSALDLQRIQEICAGMHVSDILARLAA